MSDSCGECEGRNVEVLRRLLSNLGPPQQEAAPTQGEWQKALEKRSDVNNRRSELLAREQPGGTSATRQEYPARA